MSNFSKKTVHPETKKLEMADWLDDHFGQHHYGVRFADGKIFDAELIGDPDYIPPPKPAKNGNRSKKKSAIQEFVESFMNDKLPKWNQVPQPQVMLPTEVYPILDILPRLWSAGYKTVEQDGEWHLFRNDGEGIVSGKTFRDLCVNIVLSGI